MLKSALIVACTAGVVVAAQEAFSPARYRGGTVPALPVLALGGGQVFLELAVSRDGRVTAATALRTTPPFTGLVADAVREWQFVPAEEDVGRRPGRADESPSRTPVASKVLVAAVFRPPALNAPTLGDAPRDIASASGEIAFPLATTVPPFPPLAFTSGVVLLEARVDRRGAVADVTVVRSAPPFDDAARAAMRQWNFRPARVQGVPVSTLVYVLFGFPIPVRSVPTVPGDPGVNPPGRAPGSPIGFAFWSRPASQRRAADLGRDRSPRSRARARGFGCGHSGSEGGEAWQLHHPHASVSVRRRGSSS